MKIALVGDAFLDEYLFGNCERLSPEAPVPVLDVTRRELRGGGVLNVALNLHALGIGFDVFTIWNSEEIKFPFRIISPKVNYVLKKTRLIGQLNHQLLRVDDPKFYSREDIAKAIYPKKGEYDIIAFIDYNKGMVNEGQATIIDSKKKDLSCFEGSQILKVNEKEWNEASNTHLFPQAFVTKGPKGIDYYLNGKFQFRSPTQAKEVIDVTGAGDTVTSVLIFCLAKGIKNPKRMAELANRAAGIAVGKFGTSIVNYERLFKRY